MLACNTGAGALGSLSAAAGLPGCPRQPAGRAAAHAAVQPLPGAGASSPPRTAPGVWLSCTALQPPAAVSVGLTCAAWQVRLQIASL